MSIGATDNGLLCRKPHLCKRSSHESKISGQTESGFLEAQAYLNEVTTKWIADFENPTPIILLAHSHGTVWATLLAMNNLDVTFDYFIYLDGICWQLRLDSSRCKQHLGDLGDYYHLDSRQLPPLSYYH
jgi:hypothetical protein